MYYIKVENNVKIAVEDINPTGKKTIVLLHGWPLGRKIFEYQNNFLPAHGFRCIGIDLRGFGDSDCPFNGYSYDRMAQDVCTVIRTMDLNNITLAGFSMGGAIAIRYMARFQGSQVNRLVLLSAAAPVFTQRPNYPYGMTKEQVDMLIDLAYRDRPQMVVEFSRKLFASHPSIPLQDWFLQIGWNAGGISTIRTAESLRDEDLRDDLCKISVPTGIFHGKLDQICPYEFAMAMHEGIAKSELYTFEHSGHAVFYDELESFNKRLLTFLDR